MKYPINIEVMREIYKQDLESDGTQFTPKEDAYLCDLVKMINDAYYAGLEEGKKND